MSMRPDYDPTDLAGNDAREAASSKLSDIATAEAKRDLTALLATPGGQRVVWRILDRAGVFRTSMTGNSHTFFNEGKRDIGLFLLAEIAEHCPQHLARMLSPKNA